jgi:hypothetical protein
MATNFMWVAGDGITVGFLRRKITFYFNCPRNPDADARSWRVGSSKDFEICGVLKKLPRFAGRTSYQANQHG